MPQRKKGKTQKRLASITDIKKVLLKSKKPVVFSRSEVMLLEVVEADFRTSEYTMWMTYVSEHPRKKFKSNETVMFLNKARKIAYWILGESVLEGGGASGYATIILDSRKWRIEESGTWHHANIEKYAAAVGFSLIIPGRKTIEDVLAAAG